MSPKKKEAHYVKSLSLSTSVILVDWNCFDLITWKQANNLHCDIDPV
jgi:hypothetical protein